MTNLYLKSFETDSKIKKCLNEWLTIRKIIKSCKENEQIDSTRNMCKTFFKKWELHIFDIKEQGLVDVLFDFLEEDISQQIEKHYVR